MTEGKEIILIRQLVGLLEGDDYRVGDKLPSERKLSEQFNASRNTVRGAIRTLVARGAVEVKRSSGYYLLSKSALNTIHPENDDVASKKRISEQLEAFFLFEPDAVILATERMSKDQKKQIEECVVRMSNAILENNIDQIVDSHRSFHCIIAAGTGNEAIRQMLERLEITYVMVANVMCKISQVERNSVFARHVNLFKAINSGDVTAARKMSHQMILSTALLLNKYENIPLPKVIDNEITDQIIEMKSKRSETSHE